jgi:hypothetical protein
VGYLNYLAAAGLGNVDRERIDIIGSADPDKHIIKYKLHRNIERQLEWKDPLNPQSGRTPGNPPRQQQPR